MASNVHARIYARAPFGERVAAPKRVECVRVRVVRAGVVRIDRSVFGDGRGCRRWLGIVQGFGVVVLHADATAAREKQEGVQEEAWLHPSIVSTKREVCK